MALLRAPPAHSYGRGPPGSSASARSPHARKMASHGAVKIQLQQFMDDWLYRVLHSSCARSWTRRKAIAKALNVLVLNGVELDDMEVENCLNMEEPDMIDYVAFKMPIELRESFEHLSMQLQMILTMTTRLRKCLEAADHETLLIVVEESGDTKIGRQFLSMATIHAAKEVSTIHDLQDSWIENMETRLERLFHSAEYAEKAGSQLVAVEAQLSSMHDENKKKTAAVLQGLVDGSDNAVLRMTFASWMGLLVKLKMESGIREKFEKQIQDNEEAFRDAKRKKIAGVRSCMTRTAYDGELGLVRGIWAAWLDELKMRQRDGDTNAKAKALQAKLQKFADEQKLNTKNVLSRMAGNREATLLGFIWTSWLSFSEDYKKDKEFEDAVKNSEKQLKAFRERKRDAESSVLERMTAALDSGMVLNCFKAWTELYSDAKLDREMANRMDGANGRLKNLSDRQRSTASSVQTRINEQMSVNLLARVLAAWLIDTKTIHIENYYTSKLESKRRQLNSVQGLFKSFAKQLEEGLNNVDGESSDRGKHSSNSSSRARQGMKETVSLPDIHKRPMVC